MQLIKSVLKSKNIKVFEKVRNLRNLKESRVEVGIVNLRNFPTGSYSLELEVTDAGKSNVSSTRKRFFLVNPSIAVEESIIQKNDYLVIVLSPNSVNSRWVHQELSSAQIKELETGRVVVLPVLYQDCDFPQFLKDKQYADCREDRYPQGL